MGLLQCTSRAVCTEREKHQPSCLHWDEFSKVYQPSCLHWKGKTPAELFLLRWVYYSVPAGLYALKGESTSWAVLCWDELTTVYPPSCLHCKYNYCKCITIVLFSLKISFKLNCLLSTPPYILYSFALSYRRLRSCLHCLLRCKQ